MRKIRLSDADLELFDLEISPTDYTFYTRHKDAFKTMWAEQGKQFWIRFVITFRSFTVRHGVIKQMNIDSPKFQNLIDQAFIYVQEQFVEGKVSAAKNFLEDVALLAQNQDKFSGLDSKSFSKDPFYHRGTRELFRKFFGPPDQKTSYLKVYILCPIYLRFGGSICRCLIRWVDAEPMDPDDISYWNPPTTQLHKSDEHDTCEHKICQLCCIYAESNFYCELEHGKNNGPICVESWKLGDPRFNDPNNPLFAPHLNGSDDWRKTLCLNTYIDFYQYAKLTYLSAEEQCEDCHELRRSCDRIVQAYKSTKKKQKKKDKDKGNQENGVNEDDDDSTCNQITARFREKLIKATSDVKPEFEFKDEQKDKKPEDKKKTDKDGKENTEPMCVFGNDAKVTSDIEFPIGSGCKCKPSKVAGFKVIKIEDEENGFFEVNISACPVNSDEEKNLTKNSNEFSPENFLNKYILTKDLLIAKIDGLPQRLEWWEGKGFAVAVLNYEKEEKEFTQKWTNFAIKICGKEEVSIKQMMIKLLFYVAKRKKRTCHGWCMEVDDIVACMLPEDTPDIQDLSISIQRGFRFEDRLLDEERNSLLKHQPNLRLDKVLMGVEPGDVQKVLKKNNGKEKLKKALEACAGKDIYNSNLPDIDEETLRKMLNKKELSNVDILWEKVMTDPENAEFFVLMEREKEFDLWDCGLKTMDIRYYMNNKNPTQRICPTCKIVDQDCSCDTPMCISPDISQFIDKSNFQDVKLLGELDDTEVPKMAYKELNSFKMDNEEKTTVNKGKEKKGKKTKGNKGKVIELNDMPARFKEVGIISEKTTVTIPTKQEQPLIGNTPMNMINNVDKMAPIPGLSSSLNFTFHNGKVEQTISVSLGAYMPEDTLNLIAESEKINKLYKDDENEDGEDKKMKSEKKEKKKSSKSKKDKSSPGKASLDDIKSKEKQAELTAILLNEVIGNPEAKSAENQLNKHLGISSKKQQDNKKSKIWSKYDPDFKDSKTTESGENEDHSNDGVSVGKDELESVTKEVRNVDLKDKDQDTINTARKESAENGVPENDINMKESKGKEARKKGPIGVESGIESPESKSELKKCWNCDIIEPKRKAFKKCQKCKEEGVENCRYYCGRDCQVEDWKKRHKMEHKCKSFYQ